MRSDINSTASAAKEKEKERLRIAQDVDDFLKQGSSIKVIDSGHINKKDVHGHTYYGKGDGVAAKWSIK